MSIAICLLMITSLSIPITQNAGQPQNNVQPTSGSGELLNPSDSSRPTYPQNIYYSEPSQKDANDLNPIPHEPSSNLSTWMVWIESLISDKDQSESKGLAFNYEF